MIVGRRVPRPAPVLGGLAVATAAVYGLFFLWQFPLLGHVGSTAAQVPAIAPGRLHAVLLVVGWLLLGTLYVVALRACRDTRGRGIVAIIAGGSVVFGLLMLFTYPFGSTDVFDYVARAHLAADKGANPMYYSPASYPGYPYYQYITSVGVAGTYGPMWQAPTDWLAGVLGAGIVRNLFGIKLFVLACYWCGIPIVHWALRRAMPAHATAGLLLYAWNPLALVELGANGHNDGVQVLFLVVAGALMLARKPVPSAIALVAASLVKFSPLLVLPLFIAALLRLPTTWPRRVASLAIFAACSSVMTVLLYVPFGTIGLQHNLADLLGHGDLRANSLVWSVFGTSTAPAANIVARAALVAVVGVVAYHTVMLLLPSSSTERLPAEVLRRSFLSLLALLALGLTWFWPWYVLWLLPFAALTTSRAVRTLMVVFTLSAFAIHGASYYETLFGSRGTEAPLMAVMFGPLAVTAVYVAWKRAAGVRPRPAS